MGAFKTRGGADWTPSYLTDINPATCIGCGRCFKVCPQDVMALYGVDAEGTHPRHRHGRRRRRRFRRRAQSQDHEGRARAGLYRLLGVLEGLSEGLPDARSCRSTGRLIRWPFSPKIADRRAASSAEPRPDGHLRALAVASERFRTRRPLHGPRLLLRARARLERSLRALGGARPLARARTSGFVRLIDRWAPEADALIDLSAQPDGLAG